MNLTNALDERQQQLIRYWLPPIIAGAISWFVLIFLGDTPLIRASGLALVIVGIGLAIRRMGALLCVSGSLVLAFSPAFWTQTGGGQGEPATIVIAITAAVGGMIAFALLTKRPALGAGIGVVLFALLFFSQIGTPRSLRLTGFVVSWLMFLLVDMLLLTNPRPDSPAAPLLLRYRQRDGELFDTSRAQPYHIYGILLMFCVGVLNDPLITLLAPGIVIGLLLTRTEMPVVVWGVFMLFVGIGLRGLYTDYFVVQGHFLALHRWREAARWIDMIEFVVSQFTVVGIVLSALGLARLARWYPPLGTTLMILYAFYGFFGLVYTGPNRAVLLLPLLIIHIVWMTYAVFAVGEWGANLFKIRPELGRQLVRLAYFALPVFLFWQITQ